MGTSKAGVYFSVVLAMVFWGFTFVVYKYTYTSFQPISIIFFRLAIAIFFLFGFAILFKRLTPLRRQDLRWIILLALFEPFFYFLGEVFGMREVSSTVGAVVISTIPLLVPFAAYFFYRERLTRLNILGLAISFSGVLLVILTREGELSASLKGILLMLVAVISAIGYTMVVKKLTDHYTPISITAYQSLVGLVLMLPLFLLVDLKTLHVENLTREGLLGLLYLGVFGSGICFILFATGIRELGAARANIFANLVPVVAAFASFLLLKEAMPLQKVMGIVLVIAGLFLSQVSGLIRGRAVKRNGFRHPPYS